MREAELQLLRKDGMTDLIPLYITRPDSDGDTAQWGVTPRMAVVVILIVTVNFLLWGTVGIVYASKLLIGAFGG